MEASIRVKSGRVSIADGVSLYYEIRSPASGAVAENRQKLIMIMGAFATLKHFDEQAQAIVEHFSATQTPFEVLTYDHRGIGKSAPAPIVKQTSIMLAQDALALINQVWGDSSQVHVYGASLGGMVAQELAAFLVQQKQQRLKSLYLAVTSRGSYIRPMAIIGPGLWSTIVSMLIKSDRNKMVREVLLPASFSPETMKTQGERYAQIWLADYEAWWAFGDRDACACQASAAAVHYLTSEKIDAIRKANVPITVQIATKDKLMPVAKQRELVKLLSANSVSFDQGHMGDDSVKKQLYQASITHLENSVN